MPLLNAVAAAATGRSSRTKKRLHQLRRELANICPPPSSLEEARDEIILAMARAHLTGWTLPALSGPSAKHAADGSVHLLLISHVVIINPSGAFRIIDQLAPQTIYFEMHGRDGSTFIPSRAID